MHIQHTNEDIHAQTHRFVDNILTHTHVNAHTHTHLVVPESGLGKLSSGIQLPLCVANTALRILALTWTSTSWTPIFWMLSHQRRTTGARVDVNQCNRRGLCVIFLCPPAPLRLVTVIRPLTYVNPCVIWGAFNFDQFS